MALAVGAGSVATGGSITVGAHFGLVPGSGLLDAPFTGAAFGALDRRSA